MQNVDISFFCAFKQQQQKIWQIAIIPIGQEFWQKKNSDGQNGSCFFLLL